MRRKEWKKCESGKIGLGLRVSYLKVMINKKRALKALAFEKRKSKGIARGEGKREDEGEDGERRNEKERKRKFVARTKYLAAAT